MAQGADFAMLHTTDQWLRAAHLDTALDVEAGTVQLAWQVEEAAADAAPAPTSHAGLAFDPWCRLYRSLPEAGSVEKWLWASEEANEPVPLFETADDELGDFSSVGPTTGPLSRPRGLAIDDGGNLFIADTGGRRLLVFDLMDRRLLRQIPLDVVPERLATDGERVFGVLLGDPELAEEARAVTGPWGETAEAQPPTPLLMILERHRQPRWRSLPDTVTDPGALAVSRRGDLFVLDAGGTADARVVPVAQPDLAFEVPWAAELLFQEDDLLVVARRAGEDFLRFRVQDAGFSELPQLTARHYDGRGIVLTPDGHVGYWSDRGFMRATLARVRYAPVGRVTGFRLDSGAFQTRWGRLFVDACIPRGTDVRIHCLVQDEPPEIERLLRTPPANAIAVTIHRPDLSPPMPPKALVDSVTASQRLHRRSRGSEMPWLCREGDDRFVTYEAPIIAPAGRYLWVVLELTGTARSTPRVRSLRAEYPAHDLLRRLPRIYSRKEPEADFLRRYLAIMEGDLRDLDQRASCREILLNPLAAPASVLPWLAGFIGLALDKRWSETVRRQLVAEGIWLFRYRGTVPGLKRFLEIVLQRSVIIIEHFKTRGLGGALLGEADALTSNSILGAGFRIGGQLDQDGSASINEVSISDAITTHAHRFSVVLPLSLDTETEQVIRHILDTHRPAHTLVDICTVDSGMRVGLGLHLGLTSLVGRTSGFGQLQVGGSILGRSDVIGRPRPGTAVGASRLGGDSRVG